VAWTRAALALVAAGAVALAVVSGGSGVDPRTPAALPGSPAPFLGTAVIGTGKLTAAVDAYGDVVDLRPGPASRALVDNPVDRQAAGSVPVETGIVPRVSIGGSAPQALWQAESVAQRYLPGTNVLRTVARFGPVKVVVSDAARGPSLARVVEVAGPPGARIVPRLGIDVEEGLGLGCKQRQQGRRLAMVCSTDTGPALAGDGVAKAPVSSIVGAQADAILRAAVTDDRRWLGRARPLSPAAPEWVRRMYSRSLLTLRALTDRRTGAVAAGARDGWAYVWPRDAGAAALSFAASGYQREARRIAGFLLDLDLEVAARFHGDGSPVEGREAQGDASGWVAVAARAAGVPSPAEALPWRERADYQEGSPGTYLGNAIAATAESGAEGPRIPLYGGKSADRREGSRIAAAFATSRGLVRRAGDPGSGLDSAAAWAVRPFALPALFPSVRRTLLALVARRTRFGLTPGEDWEGTDPWMAPTAWMAWSLAALSDREQRQGPGRTARHDRRIALGLLGDLRRAATPAGALPERVDARTGVPASTTPLAWSHAFAILALRQLWPDRSEADEMTVR
jgi:hypothetical protein